MASARDLAKRLTNSAYLPSLEFLMRSCHNGSAAAQMSSSVASMMFRRDSAVSADTGSAALKTPAMSALLPQSEGPPCAPCIHRSLAVRHQVITRRLLHRVLAALRIAARNGQHVPVRVVHLHRIAPVVVARPAR